MGLASSFLNRAHATLAYLYCFCLFEEKARHLNSIRLYLRLARLAQGLLSFALLLKHEAPALCKSNKA